MEVVEQTLEELLGSLNSLEVEWQDDVARSIIRRVEQLPVKELYGVDDIKAILDANFSEGLLICGLFLGLSKDSFRGALAAALKGGSGKKRYQNDEKTFLSALEQLGVPAAMAEETTRRLHWSDRLIERLRTGRGSAISGQRRGRNVEDFAEAIIRKVFNQRFHSRCNFKGPRGAAKCDFAIPSKEDPRIVVEAKGYAATGSKMTDIIGDIEKIIAVKRPDTAFLFFTDGLTWRQRQSDLRKIVGYQNSGDISRIYTHAMADRLESDLRQLKEEYRL
jgi:hypothetical protein